ncbi:protein FAR1-RELATED SEQUENCE 11 [Rhizophagus irregularis DAOM 181602=DAOM 197198]|nr:protein FAR1-RELATED SEQUENCE 11 [Rhizophagus irregularis DAOM 181602=DAOM 197198]
MQQENSEPVLYQGKAFTTWKQAFETIESRAKQQGFNIIYSRVEKKSDGTFRRRTAQCEHHGNYVTKSNKETTTKRLGCAWHINLSEPTSKNPFKYVYITTLHDIHSHNLNPNIIQFGDNKYIPPEIMKEIEFLTIKCRMGAATQRQYLEAKFPGQIIYDNDLYKAIQHFRPQNKDDSNDAAKLYTKLLELSQNNPMWKVAIKFDNNNTLTHLFWMTPSQLELWYRYSDIVVQDVTCKTNRYEMALSLFIILDENRNVRLVAQALLIDETKESHEWSFEQLNLATNNVYPQVIMTDADPAVHAAIRSTFPTTYPMHCTFHISQNLIKKVQKLIGNKFQEFFTKFHAVRNTLNTLSFESEWRKLITQYPEIQQYLINTLYNTKESWAHPWTCHQFTAGLHASSPVESINAWIKSYIFNSNISLCELGDVIERRQMAENKKYQLVLWKAAIPCMPTQISTAAFMFTSINQKLEEYLPPAILELQRDEIRQCVFYNAVQVTQEVIDEFDKVYITIIIVYLLCLYFT